MGYPASTNSIKMTSQVLLLSMIICLAQSQSPPLETETEVDLTLPTLADLGIDKAAILESLAELTNTTILFERLGDFFDFENAGQTQLGTGMCWKEVPGQGLYWRTVRPQQLQLRRRKITTKAYR